MSQNGLKEDMISRTPLGRLGSPKEVGEVIAFLLSDASSFVSGGEFSIDGGVLTTIPGSIFPTKI